MQATEAILDEIERSNSVLDCYITILRESALKQAEAADRALREGRDLGPLQGAPIAIKDIIYIRGVKCTAGSKILENNVAGYDSPVARRLKDAGAVFLGTTNLHEFASGVTSSNPHFGAVRNPWDLERIPGGSSGGSAAAVAAGLTTAAIGTDTAGSVRIPAALCGVVGLKPTYGRISRVGVIPLASSFDTVGTLSASVWDSAALLSVLAGRDPADLTTADIEVPDYISNLAQAPSQVRIGVPRKYFLENIDDPVLKSFDRFTERLAKIGCSVADSDLEGIEGVFDIFAPIRRAEASAFHERWFRETPESYGPDVRAKLELGLKVSAATYINAQNSRPGLRQRFLESMKNVDFLAVPTTCTTASKIGEETATINGKDTDVYSALISLTLPFNVVGFPAVSLPAGLEMGLPVGVQLVGRPYEEAGLLSLAYRYEESFGPFPSPSDFPGRGFVFSPPGASA